VAAEEADAVAAGLLRAGAPRVAVGLQAAVVAVVAVVVVVAELKAPLPQAAAVEPLRAAVVEAVVDAAAAVAHRQLLLRRLSRQSISH
jgi:hypothetical protein